MHGAWILTFRLDSVLFRPAPLPLLSSPPHYRRHVTCSVDSTNSTPSNPTQLLPAVYKVDWKVCFTKWAKINSKMAMYHAFVEDDSFLCTGHLLHLTTILSNMSKEERGLPFRTGNHTSQYTAPFNAHDIAPFDAHYIAPFDAHYIASLDLEPLRRSYEGGH
jgi:hypothetical protein